jgi:hypothetical protein
MVAALVIGVLVGVLVAGDSNGGAQTTVTETAPPPSS